MNKMQRPECQEQGRGGHRAAEERDRAQQLSSGPRDSSAAHRLISARQVGRWWQRTDAGQEKLGVQRKGGEKKKGLLNKRDNASVKSTDLGVFTCCIPLSFLTRIVCCLV